MASANDVFIFVEFEINEECRDFLKSLAGPIGVISVAGMYRSGKSYLLNRVLLNRSRGFDVGHTINACTKVSHLAKSIGFEREVFWLSELLVLLMSEIKERLQKLSLKISDLMKNLVVYSDTSLLQITKLQYVLSFELLSSSFWLKKLLGSLYIGQRLTREK